MLGRTLNPSVDSEDPVSAAVRIVRGLDPSDFAAFIRRIELRSAAELDLPRRFDIPIRFRSGRQLAAQAGAALARLLDQLPNRREQRRRRRAVVIGLLGVVGLAVVGSWLGRREMARRSARAEAERLDQEAFERATSEGMGGAIGVPVSEPVPVPMDMSVPDEDLMPAALEETRTERTVIDQATNGIGVAPRA